MNINLFPVCLFFSAASYKIIFERISCQDGNFVVSLSRCSPSSPNKDSSRKRDQLDGWENYSLNEWSLGLMLTQE